ncbi:MAG TPA: ComF family protein [Bacillota bacterium]|nr:ComF family protein [Bacillota bacterium]
MKLTEVKKILTEISRGMMEIVFPAEPVCPVCREEPALGRGLGRKCLNRIALIVPPICSICGRMLRVHQASVSKCLECSGTEYYFSQARAVALYDGALREYLSEVKYRYRPDLGIALGELMVEWLKANPKYGKFDLIIPVPIHPQKMAKRGYNQAELLAIPLQKHLGIPIKNDIIIRCRFTETQNALDRESRFSNVKEAFQAVQAGALTGKRVLLIDDIMTTGATASEVSRTLLRAGALDVKLLTLAAGVIDKQWLHPEVKGKF